MRYIAIRIPLPVDAFRALVDAFVERIVIPLREPRPDAHVPSDTVLANAKRRADLRLRRA